LPKRSPAPSITTSSKRIPEHGASVWSGYLRHILTKTWTQLKRFAVDALGHEPEVASTKCLTLLATAGVKDGWNSRLLSKHHKTIPLPSGEMVRAFPMISNLVSQLGLEVTEFLNPSPSMMLDIDQRTYNVFHVGDAVGSDFLVDWESFVVTMGIKSTVGFGGMLPSGNLFAVIVFCAVHVAAVIASMFRAISLSAKLALLPFADQVFSADFVERNT